MWNMDYQKALKDLQTALTQAGMQLEAYLNLLKVYSKMDWMSPSKRPKKDSD